MYIITQIYIVIIEILLIIIWDIYYRRYYFVYNVVLQYI